MGQMQTNTLRDLGGVEPDSGSRGGTQGRRSTAKIKLTKASDTELKNVAGEGIPNPWSSVYKTAAT
jgi:hypothetical protein